MDAEAYLRERAGRIERELDARIPPADEAPRALHQAMRHLLWPGGKRLRPGFAMAAAEAVGGDPERAVPIASAVELVHTYSLIHDDLPCMDDDDVRRGQPTVHVAFGEATAVLAGDALLALAFEVAASPSGSGATSGTAALGAVVDLARAAGAAGLVGGQVDDLSGSAASAPEAEVERILSVHARKSAALFVAATVGGARLAGGDAVQLETLARFAHDVGVAFQIADDRLDEGEEDAISLVRVEGLDRAAARAEALLDGALGLIEDWGERAAPLRELARFAVRRNR